MATTCATSRRTTSPIDTRTTGGRRSTSTARRRARCDSSSRTPATGSTSSTSTACGSTRRRRSTTHRRSTSLRRVVDRARQRRRRPDDLHRGRERAAGHDAGAAADGRRLRLDALWNDDFHHTAIVALTGRREAYYTDYRGSPQEFMSSAKYGYLYQGQWYAWQKQRRGSPALDLPARVLRHVPGESRSGRELALRRRLHGCRRRAGIAALTGVDAARSGDTDALSGPGVRRRRRRSSSSPITTTDCVGRCRAGRARVPVAVSELPDPEIQAALPPPDAEDTFARCKLDLGERASHAPAVPSCIEISLRCGDRIPSFRAGRGTPRGRRRPGGRGVLSPLRRPVTTAPPADRQPRPRSRPHAGARAAAGAAGRLPMGAAVEQRGGRVRRRRQAPLDLRRRRGTSREKQPSCCDRERADDGR